MENTCIPLVSVWMVTYNHEQYIRQCLESVTTQKVDFTFEVIIGEDASTDGTRAIVKEFEEKYPAIIKPVYLEKNVGASRNAYEFCFPKLTGKYIACMEGDDYWTDADKLQKQVDFLEKDLAYSICWAKYKVLKEAELIIPEWVAILGEKEVFDIDLNNVFTPYSTHTLTVMFRRQSLNFSLLKTLKYAKDNTIFCLCLSQGKGAILNFFSGVYRIHGEGTYQGSRAFIQQYSSFLNLEEIVRDIPGCNTSNLNFIRNNLLIKSYNLATSDTSFKPDAAKILRLYKKMLLYVPLMAALKATTKMLRPLLRSFKHIKFRTE